MINEKVITDKKMIQHFNPVIVRYYEDTFQKNASADEKKSESYQDFKKTLSNNQEVGSEQARFAINLTTIFLSILRKLELQ